MLDYDAFRAEQAEARAAGRYLGVGVSNYVEPSTPGLRLLRDRSGDDPHRAVGHGERVHRGRLDGEQHRDDGRAAHRRRARREHRRRQHDPGRHRGHGLRRRARPAAAAASMTAGAVRDTATILRERIARDRRAQARGRGRRHRARREPGVRARHARDRHLARRARRARLLRAVRAAARRPGRARGERALHRRRADRSG